MTWLYRFWRWFRCIPWRAGESRTAKESQWAEAMTTPADQGSSEALREKLIELAERFFSIADEGGVGGPLDLVPTLEAAFTLGRQQQAREDAQIAERRIIPGHVVGEAVPLAIAAAIRSSRAPQELEP